MKWITKTREFFKEVKAEYKKVSFPSRQEVVGTTVVVLIACAIFAVYLWVADILILRMYQFVIGIFS